MTGFYIKCNPVLKWVSLPIFPAVLQRFDLECHEHASLKATFVLFGPVFMKFRNFKIFHREKKKLILLKLSWGKNSIKNISLKF